MRSLSKLLSIGPGQRHRFVLTIEGVDLLDGGDVDRLFTSGCGDAIFSFREGESYAAFSRRADSGAAAIGGAVSAVEAAVPGARVLHVEREECERPGAATPVKRATHAAIRPLSRLLQARTDLFVMTMNAAFRSRVNVKHVETEEERRVLHGFIEKEIQLLR